jgi:hypothetical protein
MKKPPHSVMLSRSGSQAPTRRYRAAKLATTNADIQHSSSIHRRITCSSNTQFARLGSPLSL